MLLANYCVEVHSLPVNICSDNLMSKLLNYTVCPSSGFPSLSPTPIQSESQDMEKQAWAYYRSRLKRPKQDLAPSRVWSSVLA